MARKPLPPPKALRRMRGFEPAFGLMRDPVRAAGEARGFAIARLVTHWPEVVGDELAAMTRPVKISYGREGLGATLVLLVAAAQAPMVQMQERRIRERVNAVYGYNAIGRIHMTQTAPVGFAEGQADFTHAPKARSEDRPADPAIVAKAHETAAPIRDEALRQALERLAQNILTRKKT